MTMPGKKALKMRKSALFKETGVLNVSANEFKLATEKAKNIAPNLALSSLHQVSPYVFLMKKEEFGGEAAGCYHDAVVVIKNPDAADPNEYQYEIGMMARSEAYFRGFRLVKEGVLGSGNFGTVSIVQWQDGTTNAIKQAKKTDPSGVDTREIDALRLLGRLKAFSNISQDNIMVLTREIGIPMDSYFYTPSYSRISMEKRYEAGIKAAIAIRDLHEKHQILHGDIKAGNFMFNPLGDIATVAAIDFGFSRKLAEGQSQIIESNKTGSKGYLAPEIEDVAENFTYSRASDVYAFVIMLIEDLGLIPSLRKFLQFVDVPEDLKSEIKKSP